MGPRDDCSNAGSSDGGLVMLIAVAIVAGKPTMICVVRKLAPLVNN